MDAGVFRNGESLNVVIVGFLIVFGINLDPSCVSGAHAVRVVAVDIDGTGKRAVYQGQDQRQAVGGRQQQFLPHECQACGGGRCHGPGTGRFGSDRRGHGGVLALNRYEFCIDLSVGNIGGDHLGNLGGRRDREGGHDIRIHLPDCVGDCLVSGHSLSDAFHGSIPSFISMAPKGHTLAQIPQPLQWS